MRYRFSFFSCRRPVCSLSCCRFLDNESKLDTPRNSQKQLQQNLLVIGSPFCLNATPRENRILRFGSLGPRCPRPDSLSEPPEARFLWSELDGDGVFPRTLTVGSRCLGSTRTPTLVCCRIQANGERLRPFQPLRLFKKLVSSNAVASVWLSFCV